MIVAFDPGKTSAIVAADNIAGKMFNLCYAAEIPEQQHCSFLQLFFSKHASAIQTIVIERFVLFNNAKTMQAQINSDFPACQTIGMLRMIAHIHDLTDRIVYQSPSDRLNVKTIPAVHWERVKYSEHIQAAYKHLKYYILLNSKKALL